MANDHDLDPIELLKCANRSKAARIAALEALLAQATALLRQCRREAWDEYSADGAAIYARIDAFIGAPDAVPSEPDFSRYDPALE